MIRLPPPRRVHGFLRVPGDKSISHRALIFGALVRGMTRVAGLSGGGDVHSSRRVLEALGITIRDDGGDVLIEGRGVEHFRAPDAALDCGNSGTTARLMAGVLAGAEGRFTLSGDDSLSRRPMARVVNPLRAMGAVIEATGERRTLPISISGTPLKGARHELEVASAQVKSALLLAGLRASGPTTIVEPTPTRDHSERMLSLMGARLEVSGPAITIYPGPLRPAALAVPGDFSSAAFFLTLAALHPDADVTIEGVNLNPTRIGLAVTLKEMGADISWHETTGGEPSCNGGGEPVGNVIGEPVGSIRCRSSRLRGIALDPAHVPLMIDELPLLAVAATQAEGRTIIRGAAELRHKESDRIARVAGELRKFGARVAELPDGFDIQGPTPLVGATLASHGDHRIAMSAAVAACIASGESVIEDERWVDISYPLFWEHLASLGVELRQ